MQTSGQARSASASPSRPRRNPNPSPRAVVAKKNQIDPSELVERVQELESFKKQEEKDKKTQETAKKKEMMMAKKKLAREIQSCTKEVRSKEKEANKLASQLKKLHTQELDTEAKKARSKEKFDDQNSRLVKKQLGMEEDLHKKREYEGAAKGKLAHLERAQEMLEQGIVIPLDMSKSSRGNDEPVAALTNEPHREEVVEEVALLRDEVERLQDENEALRSKIEMSQKTIESQSRRIEQMSGKMEDQQDRLQTCEAKLGRVSAELLAAPAKERDISVTRNDPPSPLLKASSYTPQAAVVVEGVDVLNESRYATVPGLARPAPGTQFVSNSTPRRFVMPPSGYQGYQGYAEQGHHVEFGYQGYPSYGYEGIGSPSAPPGMHYMPLGRPGWQSTQLLGGGVTLVGGHDTLAASVPNLAPSMVGQGHTVIRAQSNPRVQGSAPGTVVRTASPIVRVLGPGGGQEIGAGTNFAYDSRYESTGIPGVASPAWPYPEVPTSAFSVSKALGGNTAVTQVSSNGGLGGYRHDRAEDFGAPATIEMSTQTSKRGSTILGATAQTKAGAQDFAKAVHQVTAQALRDYRLHHADD